MSIKQFEDFLVNHFIENIGNDLSAGNKYQFSSPNLDNSKNLWQAFTSKDLISGSIFISDVKLVYVECNEVKLIPVVHTGHNDDIGYTENFISFLRDEVSEQKGDFHRSALLIIHDSLLDTIINSSMNLSKNGRVFSPFTIKQSLGKLIDETDSSHGKNISRVLLDYQFDLIDEDSGSMFGFESLYTAISNGSIRFHEIGLLNDPDILTWSENDEQLKNRLTSNRKLVEEINKVIEHYPDQLVENLPFIGEDFINENFSNLNCWKDNITYNDILKEQNKNKKQNLEFTKIFSTTGELVERCKSNKGAAKKERHIILVVDSHLYSFDLSLEFFGSKIITKEVIFYDKLKEMSKEKNVEISSSSINPKILITGVVKEHPKFFAISLKRQKTSEKFSFKCLVVKVGKFNINAIKNYFIINPQKQFVKLRTQDTSIKISVNDQSENEEILREADQCFRNTSVDIVNFEDYSNHADQVVFTVKSGNSSIKFEVEGAGAADTLSLPLLFDSTNSKNIFLDDFFGIYNRDKQRIYIQNREVKISSSALCQLSYEAIFIDNDYLFLEEGRDSFVTIDEVEGIAPRLSNSYKNLFNYYKENKTLPSLCGWGAIYISLVKDVVESFYEYLSSIKDKQYLSYECKRIVNIGFLRKANEKGSFDDLITPFHPLVLSYYYYLVVMASNETDSSFIDLPSVTRNRLNPQGLLPFIYHETHDFSYVNVDESNCFWLHCVPQQETSYNYVSKLVKDKITEFSDAFATLFDHDSSIGARPTFYINSINNCDNYELFFGISEFIVKNLNNTFNIHVNIYDDEFHFNEFDNFSEMTSYDAIKKRYKLTAGKAKDHSDTIVELLRTRVTYSKFLNHDITNQEYAHISFFKNNQKVKVVNANPLERPSGISCHGLINGETSVSEEGNYVTGFGLDGVDIVDIRPLEIAVLLGRMIHPARESAIEYRDNSAIAVAVDDSFKELLEKSYKSSIWTSIIDPKVTLDFFSSNDDMLLIHYSDQYTSSSSYDAITVTRQTELYENVLLKDGDDKGLIGEFNAFNGEWLLKMITDQDNIRKEHKGILAAYKLVSCLLFDSDIVWVPMSAAEMIRVSGNIGLNFSESEFSRYNHGYKKGEISDDVLFVGFKDKDLYLLPLEVKTGRRPDYNKAVKQAKELKRYLSDELLSSKSFAHNLYRGLFIRQVLMQIDKYELYSVYPKGYFSPLITDKEWWLQGDYRLKNIVDYPEGFVVANLDEVNCFETDAEEDNGILKINVPSNYLPHLVSTPISELLACERVPAISSLPDKYFLKSSYKRNEVEYSKVTSNFEEIVNDNSIATLKVDKPTSTMVAVLPASSDALYYGESEVNESGIANFSTSEISNDHIVISSSNNATVEPLKVLVGHDVQTSKSVYWEPTNTSKFMNTNSGIIGTMGTGKTQCTKSVVTQLYRNQHKNVNGKTIGMLIFDYKSDYVDDQFIKATNAKKFKLFKLPYNPLSLFGDTPMLPIHTAASFSETLSKAFSLGKKQQLVLENIILECYEKSGILPEDPTTWCNPAPTIEDIWSLYLSDEPDEDSLYAALSKLARFKIFEDDNNKLVSLYELIDGITVIELAGYPPQVQNLIVALTLDLFYSQMQKKGKPMVDGDFREVTKLLLVDEADNFMSQNFSSLRKILKEGREYGVGVILSTQDITHFKTKENDYSSYILSWAVHRVSKIKSQDIQSIFNIDDKTEQEYLMRSIRGLEKHYSLYVDGDKRVQKIKDKAFWELLN